MLILPLILFSSSSPVLTEKPVTLAIQEVADGKLDARNMDLTIEEPEDLQPAEEEAQ